MRRIYWPKFQILLLLLSSLQIVKSNFEYQRSTGDECESGRLCRPPSNDKQRCTTKEEFKDFLDEACNSPTMRNTCEQRLIREIVKEAKVEPEEVKEGLHLSWLDDECKSGKCVLEMIDEVGWGVCAAGTKIFSHQAVISVLLTIFIGLLIFGGDIIEND